MKAAAASLFVLTLLPVINGRECGMKELTEQNVTGCTTLEHVTLAIGHRNAIWLGDALHHNVHLEYIDLHHTALGDDDAISLAAGLENNTYLKRLALHNNRIFDAGAVAIGKALANNNALEELVLSSNGIGDVGAKALAEGLRSNGALRRLDLYVNLITDVGAVALAEALSDNRALRSLHVDTNQIGDVGALAFAKALEGSMPGGEVEEAKRGWDWWRSSPPPSPAPEVRPALLGELTLMYSHLTNTGADALMAAAKKSTHIHRLAIDANHMMSGDTHAAWKEEHGPAMKERETIAMWIIAHGLVSKGGRHSLRQWHGDDNGPPLASVFAPAVRALKLHTQEGIAALQHETESSLGAHPELQELAPDDRDGLIRAILAERAKSMPEAHDEL